MRAAVARVAVGLALAAPLAGCSSEADTFSLRLVFSDRLSQACPHPAGVAPSCATVPMSCNARVRIRITNATGAEQLYSTCYRVENPVDACALRDLPIEASAPLPNAMAKVQVMVWSEDQLAAMPERLLAADGCPVTVPFSNDLLPNVNIDDKELVPALGGEIYFPVGDRRVAEVELGCPRYDLLDTAACREGTPDVRATVRVPVPWSFLEDVPETMVVRFGPPNAVGDGTWELRNGDLVELAPSGGADHRWTAPYTRAVPTLGCVDIDSGEASSTSVATCRDVAVQGGEIAVEGVAAFRAFQRELLRALGLTEVPGQGLVLGIVLESTGLPAAGAHILSPAGVVYPSADFSRVDLDATSATGLFVSRTAPFDTAWRAEGPGGIGDDGSARGGLIAERLSVVVVRLNPRVGGKPAGEGSR